MRKCIRNIVSLFVILLCSVNLYAEENNYNWNLSLIGFYIVTNPNPKSQYFVPPSSMNYEYFFSEKDGKVEDPIIQEIRFKSDAIIEIYRKSGEKEIGAFWELTLAHTEESFNEEYPDLFYYDPIHIQFYILKYTNSKRKTIEMTIVPGENNEYFTIELVNDSHNVSVYSIYSVNINKFVFPEKPTNSEFLKDVTKNML